MSSPAFGGMLSSEGGTRRPLRQGTFVMSADWVWTRSKKRPMRSRVYRHASPWFGTNPMRIATVIASSCGLAYCREPATGGACGKAAFSVR